MQTKIGDVIGGRYRLDGILGEGGMGAVYEATQINLNRAVAVKLMHREYGHQKEARARFEREARVSAALHHPNAVKIFDFGEDHGRLYLVMERLEGTSLRSFVDPVKDVGPLPHARTVSIGRQVAEVLIAAHKLNLVHRDLKPENIFLEVATDGSDRVVVVDFGLAFIAEREDATRMTQEGMIMGTPLYMSPEQCLTQPVGPEADIYTFGVMLYEMVTGAPPFGGSPMIILSHHIFQPPEPPRTRRTDIYVPSALERLILEMLQKKPQDRPSAEGVAQALGQLEHTLGERERARGAEHLEGRAARMIPTVRASVPEGFAPVSQVTGPRPSISGDEPTVAVIGALDETDALGLRANGFVPLSVAGPPLPEGIQAIFAPAASTSAVHELLRIGVPVIADTDASDMNRVSELLALGVADVVTRPVKIERLAKKLNRAIKKAKRGRK